MNPNDPSAVVSEHEVAQPLLDLPGRLGPPPTVIGPQPHGQRSQNAPLVLQETLLARAVALEGVYLGHSGVSVPGARALHLDGAAPTGPPEAFQVDREFAHLHPPHDGSLHMTLPSLLAERAFLRGWGQPHPLSGTPMIFGPRVEDELETIWQLLLASYRYATGTP